jgi:hypothetical protein
VVVASKTADVSNERVKGRICGALELKRLKSSKQVDVLAITEADRWFVYNGAIMNRRMLLAFTMTMVIAATGCNKNRDAAGGSTVPAKAADAVQQKLMEVAGSGATDCGRFPVQTADVQLKTASDCAMQAAQSKKPFYVGYDMPGMTVAVAGDNGGKLYSVQVQERGMVSTGPCPSEIRVAPSGRVTCFAPGQFGSGAMGGDPHGGMPMAPGGAAPSGMINPHAVIPPASEGTPNPHKPKSPKQQ